MLWRVASTRAAGIYRILPRRTKDEQGHSEGIAKDFLDPQGSLWGGLLRQQFFDHLRRLDACEFLVQTLEAIGESFVVVAEEMKHGRMKIVYGDGVLDDVVGEVIRLAVDCAGRRRRRPSTW